MKTLEELLKGNVSEQILASIAMALWFLVHDRFCAKGVDLHGACSACKHLQILQKVDQAGKLVMEFKPAEIT